MSHDCSMARPRRWPRSPISGHIEIEACNALLAFVEKLQVSPKPPRRPLDIEAEALRIVIVRSVETLRAHYSHRKVEDDIVRQVGE